jgi:hypothetical protein
VAHSIAIDKVGLTYDWAQLPRVMSRFLLFYALWTLFLHWFLLGPGPSGGPSGKIVSIALTALALPVAMAAHRPIRWWARIMLMFIVVMYILSSVFDIDSTLDNLFQSLGWWHNPARIDTPVPDLNEVLESLDPGATIWYIWSSFWKAGPVAQLISLISAAFALEIITGFLILSAASRKTATLISEPPGLLSIIGVPRGLQFLPISTKAKLHTFVVAALLTIFPLGLVVTRMPMALETAAHLTGLQDLGKGWLSEPSESQASCPEDDFGLCAAADAAIAGIAALDSSLNPLFAVISTLVVTILVITGISLFIGANLVRKKARRASYASASKAMLLDKRAPILFLRTFKDDRMLLKTRHATPLRWALNLFMRVTTLDELLVEECSQYGPIIAIGKPNERIQLFGAFREFLEDSVWQDAVENYAREAKAIIVAVDETQGLSWELELIGRNNYLSKTLLVVPDRFK